MKDFINRLNSSLLGKYPGAWLTRTHYVVALAILTFWAELFVGLQLPITTPMTLRFFWPALILLFPVFFWIRFQYLNYQPFYKAGKLYGIFVLNLINSLLIFLLVCLVNIIVVLRIQHLRETRTLEYDMAILKISSLYKQADFYNEMHYNAEKDWCYEVRDSIVRLLDTSLQKGFEKDLVRKEEKFTSKLYGIPLFVPKSGYINEQLVSIDTAYWQIRNEMNKGELVYLSCMILFFFSMGLSILIMNIILNRKVFSVFAPFFSILLYCFLFLIAYVLEGTEIKHWLFPTYACVTIAYIAILVGIFKTGKARIASIRKTLAIQAVGFGYIPFFLLLPLIYIMSGPDEEIYRSSSLLFSLFAYLLGTLCFYFFVKKYNDYSFLPKKRA